jgi:hypothetical protein
LTIDRFTGEIGDVVVGRITEVKIHTKYMMFWIQPTPISLMHPSTLSRLLKKDGKLTLMQGRMLFSYSHQSIYQAVCSGVNLNQTN